ncbi:hypothetical protein CVIRNUC_009531 [Coccomyxa viridis]|uniref:Defective in cullin neddylation protein n=1 Tax=Coccomyxa viridis TaxID=1274662 RepID=A0AAV1IG67_9CHLO|nr:hypothetical protein CVIRNUC_009531 [Coccomyxa viridis]
MEAAIEYYYSMDPGQMAQFAAKSQQQPSLSRGAVEQLYNRYRDQHAQDILAEGVGRLCEDLQVDPGDIVMLVLSWHFRAATMCEYSRDEFVSGMLRLRCDSIPKLQQRLPELRRDLQDPQKFKDVYNYAYGFTLEKGIKCLPQEVAIEMWRLLLSAHSWPLLESWCHFLEEKHNKAISKDTWVQLLDFVRAVKPDLSNFEESGSAWPYLLDDFVDWMRDGRLMDTS